MPKTLEAITHEVLELPRDQQLRLAHYVLSLDDTPVDPEIEQAWHEEICARLAAVREGRVEMIPWEKVREEVQERLRQCR